jgi:hypothetical protein
VQVRYIGRSTTGILIPQGTGERYVGHGEAVTVDNELGASLLTQEGQWERVKSTTKAEPAETPQEDQP